MIDEETELSLRLYIFKVERMSEPLRNTLKSFHMKIFLKGLTYDIMKL